MPPIRLYAELTAAGFDVLLDDRDDRPGVMFADAELIGIPHRVTVGERGLKDGVIEYQPRRAAAGRKRRSAKNRAGRCEGIFDRIVGTLT